MDKCADMYFDRKKEKLDYFLIGESDGVQNELDFLVHRSQEVRLTKI